MLLKMCLTSNDAFVQAFGPHARIIIIESTVESEP